MNNTISKMTEQDYLFWDLVPIVGSFIIGFAILVILVALVGYGKCGNIGNTLIVWLYGGRLTRVEENGHLFIDNIEVAESRWLKVLRSLLVANAVTLATLLIMIFSDTYIVKSNFDLGCLENLDCYIADSNYTEPPLNCSHFLNRNEKIACYQFILDLFQAFADAGGVLAVTTLGVVLMTKLWICYGKSRCTNVCVLHICKIAVVLLNGFIFGLLVLMIMYNRESYTTSREIGIVLKFVAVAISIIITTFTPWHVLIVDTVLNVNGSLTVTPILVNNSLIVNPAPANPEPDANPVNRVLKLEGQLDVNPVLKVNSLTEVNLVLKVKGEFHVAPKPLKVKGNLRVNLVNPVLTVSGQLEITGELRVNDVLNVNPVLDVSGQLNVTVNENHVVNVLNVKIGMLNVNGVLNVNRVRDKNGIVSPVE